jgi:ribosomal protein S21
VIDDDKLRLHEKECIAALRALQTKLKQRRYLDSAARELGTSRHGHVLNVEMRRFYSEPQTNHKQKEQADGTSSKT